MNLRASSTDWLARAKRWATEAANDKKHKRHNKWARLAAQRFLNDLKHQKTKAFPYYMCPKWADKACRFFEMLPHIEGKWKSPTIVLEDWQVFLLVNIFGWRKVSDNRRRFTTAYIEVARKNAKSAFASGIALFCLVYEDEPGPQVVCGATTGAQAKIVFDVAHKMATKLGQFREAAKLKLFANTILCMRNAGKLYTINAKGATQDGLNPHLAILDELHAHTNRDLFDVIESAQGARANPLGLYITTAGFKTSGVCYEQRTLVTKILENVMELNHYFGVIFTLDAGDDPLDPAVWIKANPNLGVSALLDKMIADAKSARASPLALNNFTVKRVNVWTNAKAGMINIAKWQECAAPVDLAALKDVPAYGAFDLASTSDLTAWVLVWQVGKKVYVRAKFYLPEETIDEAGKARGIPYRAWVEAGWITATPGNVTDYEFVQRDIEADLDAFDIRAIGYDPWNATDLANRLFDNGAPLVQMRQGPVTFNAPTKELERLYLAGNLAHAGNPVLQWNASNVVARKDANENIMPDKRNSYEKIDGIVALCMGIGVLMQGAEGDGGPSVYEQRGIIELEV